MRFKAQAYLLGTLQYYLGIVMLFPLLWAFTDPRMLVSFIIPSVISFAAGFFLRYKNAPPHDLTIKESFAFVALAWPMAALLGSLPYLFSGTFCNFIDALFESMSGFTTTGATVIEDIDALPQSILLWRSLTQWLGGMGIIVLFVAMLPRLGIRSINLLKAEVPGPGTERLTPRLAETAKRLWIVYFVFSAVQFFLLLASGLTAFDAINHTFTTMPSGGFSTYNGSVGALNNIRAETVMLIFMIITGGNFSLYYSLWQKQWKQFFKDTELRFYLFILLVASIIVTLNIYQTHYETLIEAARNGFFQVVSITTTTGYITTDYNKWPYLSKIILFILMFIGASGGSTSGAMKQIRIIILIKYAFREIQKVLHPSAVIPLRLRGKVIPEELVQNVIGFNILYIFIFLLSSIIIGSLGLDFITSLSVAASCLGNVGPALGLLGPAHTYAGFPATAKLYLSFIMLLGRLEIYTILVLLLPGAGTKRF
ncbi:MAG TPA: TrkH family potassium uptake protein [Firmicutes bacterium]|jgi:trk system potassium uptake protein TrkH|nr:TrkH family potassium uptake protein [Bacillota bacterium]